MVHYSCDMCGKDLPSDDTRFVVRIASYPSVDPDRISLDTLDEDYLESINEVIQREELGAAESAKPAQFRFDLCPACHERFAVDPLNRELLRTLNFSKN